MTSKVPLPILLIGLANYILSYYWKEILGILAGGAAGAGIGALLTKGNEKYYGLGKSLGAGAGAIAGYFLVPEVIRSIGSTFGVPRQLEWLME